MSECKRDGCKREAMQYGRYQGCCSIYCRDVYEDEKEIEQLEAEIIALKKAIEQGERVNNALKAENKRLQDELAEMTANAEKERIRAEKAEEDEKAARKRVQTLEAAGNGMYNYISDGRGRLIPRTVESSAIDDILDAWQAALEGGEIAHDMEVEQDKN